MKPRLPNSKEPIRAQWGRRLLAWIESIRPKGDGVTTKVSPGGVITAFPSAAGADLSGWQFYASLKSGTTDTVAINAGRLIRGTNLTTIAQTDHQLSLSGDGTYYVYLESWYNADVTTYKNQYADKQTDYPNQADITDGGNDYPCERFLVATVTVTDLVISAVKPERIGEIHSNRAWEDF